MLAQKSLLILLLCIVCVPLAALEVLPSGRPFRLTFADPQEIRMAVAYQAEGKLQAVVGNYFSLLGVGESKPGANRIHFGLEGRAFFTLRHEESRFPLETVDGMFGLYLEGNFGRLQWQTRLTHVSAHLADGVDTSAAIPFSREFAAFRVGYVPNGSFHLYAGISTLVHAIPEASALMVQAGGSFFLPVNLMIVPYVACDVQWRQEWNKTSISAQLGLSINRPPNRYKSFRIFYGFYTGGEQRGQFFGQSVTTHSIGLEMQI